MAAKPQTPEEREQAAVVRELTEEIAALEKQQEQTAARLAVKRRQLAALTPVA